MRTVRPVSLNDINAVELGDIDATSLAVTAASIDDGAANVTANGKYRRYRNNNVDGGWRHHRR